MGLVESDRRRAERVACALPVRLKGVGRPIKAVTVNLSRVGILMQVARDTLDIPLDAPTADVAREVNQSLGDVVVAELHYELLGALVRKGLRVVRVMVPAKDSHHVELGCDFSAALTPEEMSFLGVTLPEILPEFDVPEPEVEAAARLCAYVSAGRLPSSSVPLLASVSAVEEDSLMVRVSDPRTLPVLPDRDDAGSLLEAVTQAFGTDVHLVVVHGPRPIWAGRAQIHGVSRAQSGAGFDLQLVLDPDGADVANGRLDPAWVRAPASAGNRIQ